MKGKLWNYDGHILAEGSIRAKIPATVDITPSRPTIPGLIFTWPWLANGMKISQIFLTVSTAISLRSMQKEATSGKQDRQFWTRAKRSPNALLEDNRTTAVEAEGNCLNARWISYKSLGNTTRKKR